MAHLTATLGPLEPSPTTVSIVRLIGREMNLLDRAGITTNPDYSDYTSDAALRRLALQALRRAGAPRVKQVTGMPERTVRRFLETGRTSKERWDTYMVGATTIATEDLASLSQALPQSDEGRWRQYVKAGRRCQGCGGVLVGKQRKWCSACRARPGGARCRSSDQPTLLR